MNEDPKACGGIAPLVWLHVIVAGLAFYGLAGLAIKVWWWS